MEMYNEFVRATGLAYNGQPAKDFYISLADAVSKVDEKVWEGLSEPAQFWYNDLVRAIQEGSAIPEIPGGLPAVTAPVQRIPFKAPKPARAAKAAKAPKPEHDRANTVTWKIKEAVLENVNVTVAEIAKQLAAQGRHASDATIQVQRGNILHDLRILQSKGLLTKSFDLDKAESAQATVQAGTDTAQATA